jgi:hypothetical protein
MSIWLSSFNGEFEASGANGMTLSGKARSETKGCMISFRFNAGGIALDAVVDACAKSGSATGKAGKYKFTITDRDLRDNTCSSR